MACEDGEEYRRALKAQLRAFTEGAAAKDPLSGGAEWLMLLVRPPNSDALARGPRKVGSTRCKSLCSFTIIGTQFEFMLLADICT